MSALAPRLSIRPGMLGSLTSERCVGRARLEGDAPRLTHRDPARLAERELRDRFDYELTSLLRARTPSTGYLDDDALRFVLDRALAFASMRGMTGDRASVSLHRSVVVRDTDGEEWTGGEVDVSRTVDGVAEAIVWKLSWQAVDPVDARLELTALLLGLLQEDALDRARGWVYSPRLDQVHAVETTRAEAEAVLGEIVTAAHAADAPLRAGAWCRHCRACATCPAVAAEAEGFLESFAFPREKRAASKVSLKREATATLDAWLADGAVERLVALGEQAQVLEPAIEAVKSTIRALLERGGTDAEPLAARWELKECRGKPRAETQAVREALAPTLTRDELESASDVRLSTLESLYTARLVEEAKARGHSLSRESARQMFRAAISPVVETPLHTQLRRKAS